MCDFCKIADKQLPAHVVYENQNVIAFLDYEPIHEGHTLICPKEHVDSIDKLSEEVVSDIMKAAGRLVRAFREIYGNDSYSIMQNGGKCCDYGHAHFHIFPRYDNDGFGWVYHEGESEYSESIAEKIKEQIEIDVQS